MGIKHKLIYNRKLYPLLMFFKSLKDNSIRTKIWDIAHNRDELTIKHCGTALPGKIVYCISIDDETTGFFALLRWICTSLIYADNRGFKPYVKLGEGCRYYDKDIKETGNVFEYYFEPVSEIDESTVANASNIIHFEKKHLQEVNSTYSFQLDPELINTFSEIWKKYIHLNARTSSAIADDVHRVLDGSKKTIGIHVRGTDFKMNYNGHPIAVPLNEILAMTHDLIQKGYEQIFLATDEAQTVELFKTEFGERVKYYPDAYRSIDGTAIHDSKATRAYHHYLNGYEVIRDAVTLAQCNGLIAGVSNVSFFSMVVNQADYLRYDDLRICYHGLNDNTKIYTKGKTD